MKMTSNDIRQKFLDYFKSHGHAVVASSSLVPQNDPTLLFTNAGMVQFKDVFLGVEKKNYTRATSSQKCIRAGGKHNDLENVGYTARHHTFFEMLGNFSFGDYFKEDAIKLAWDFLTQELKLPIDKLSITVFQDDDEAEEIWLKQKGVDKTKIKRCGEKDNFWSMGDTGPCGPCTEIFYDHGESIKDPDDRFVEVWNLVFMQYDRQPDGKLIPLPKPSVDTGMGLERISAVMQGVHNNYDIDLFQPILLKAAKLANTKDITLTSLRVLADHIRSTSFLIAEGVVPSNEGRGYVLRRIIRRAIRHGHHAGISSPFFHQLVEPLVNIMGDAYPELNKNQKNIEETLLREEDQFSITLDQGLKILNQAILELNQKIIPGEIVFKLYDTYGFPVDLTADIAREKNLEIDIVGFEVEMEKQRKKSQDNQKFSGETLSSIATALKDHKVSTFTGYEHLDEITAITARLKEGLVLEKTPFYAESGGQVGDKGKIYSKDKKNIFEVSDTKKVGQHIIHYGQVTEGEFTPHMEVIAAVDKELRQRTVLNHTATHLLHAALRKILGDTVTQKGSLVEPNRLRFDFAYAKPLTQEEIIDVENLVNKHIRLNHEGQVKISTPEQAVKDGALALFGEKYGDEVRTLKLGNFSHELCGGTHVGRTGDIGFFKITSESGIASGVRRIEAVTGEGAENFVREEQKRYQQEISKLSDDKKNLQKQLDQLQSKLSSHHGSGLADKKRVINNITVLAEMVENIDAKNLREMVDQLKQKVSSGIVVLGSVQDNKANLIVGVTKDLVSKYPANELIKTMAEKIGGKGGGRADLAQAGGDKPQHLRDALKLIDKLV
ncbi:MAG: alanine--tRNA ligase [Gammaproteobacteria bacterium]|nr:alanine--tRNA ligase [Gammaproteobacteria bacterium]